MRAGAGVEGVREGAGEAAGAAVAAGDGAVLACRSPLREAGRCVGITGSVATGVATVTSPCAEAVCGSAEAATRAAVAAAPAQSTASPAARRGRAKVSSSGTS